MGQIVELTRSDLCDTDVYVSVSVRQKLPEMSVTGYSRGLLQSVEVRDRLKSCIRDRVSPEALCPPQPEDRSNRHNTRHRQRQNKSPSPKQGRRPARLFGGIKKRSVVLAVLP